ncbi:unnamed protein product [Psylliodes chrysocephalus]|uniref:Uncharacterized protein n=1 Tax=Psylliodes chrysocephalus TaxID=3402493 RepID=A0A9P0C8N6_9CUCU|nr:unnamed protein product [Psylliodes chrysocephala]
MMEDKNGVKDKIKSLNPNIFVLGCICHSFALCSSAECTKLPRGLEDFIRSIYNYFAHCNFQKFTNIKPYEMLHLVQTRWLSLHVRSNTILII